MPATSTLTSRERVDRAMERRDHDRVPRHDTYWGETIARWQDEGLVGGAPAALERLRSDFVNLAWYWPQAFPAQDTVMEETEETLVTRDGHGGLTRTWKHKSGTPEHLGWDCDSREAWEERYRPALLRESIDINMAEAQRAFTRSQQDDRWCYLAGVEPFECLRKTIGDVAFAMATIEDPEWVRDMSRIYTDNLLRNYNAVLAAGVRPHGLWTYGDMAFRTATFCSPQAYRDLIWPEHKRLCDWAHAHGMKFIYHTDGDVNAVMDLYLEAGFDCVQPLEAKAGMDVRTLAPRYGQALTLFGNIDVMTMITNDMAKLEEEIRTKFAAGMANNGYIYHSDHSVPPQVAWKTYAGIIDLVDRYGTYA